MATRRELMLKRLLPFTQSNMNRYERDYLEEKSMFDMWDHVLQMYEVPKDVLKIAVSEVRSEIHSRLWHRSKNYQGIDFNNPLKCYGYLKRYAACYGALTRRSIMQTFLHFPNELTAGLLGRSHLRVVSVGGGPGNDLLGFCSAASSDPRRCFEKLDLTLVDLMTGWKDIFDKATAAAQESSRLFQEVTVATKFVQFDLSVGCPHDVSMADLVLMTKVMSVISNTKGSTILWNIFKAMKIGAIFIFTDVDASKVLRFLTMTPSLYMKVLYCTAEKKVFQPLFYRYSALYKSCYEIVVVQKVCEFENVHTLRYV